MSAFVITRISPQSNVSWWDDESGLWVIKRKNATRFAWSWGWQVIENKQLKVSNPKDAIHVEQAPDADMDFS